MSVVDIVGVSILIFMLLSIVIGFSILLFDVEVDEIWDSVKNKVKRWTGRTAEAYVKKHKPNMVFLRFSEFASVRNVFCSSSYYQAFMKRFENDKHYDLDYFVWNGFFCNMLNVVDVSSEFRQRFVDGLPDGVKVDSVVMLSKDMGYDLFEFGEKFANLNKRRVEYLNSLVSRDNADAEVLRLFDEKIDDAFDGIVRGYAQFVLDDQSSKRNADDETSLKFMRDLLND